MGFFDPPQRPVKIRLLNIAKRSTNPMVSYQATYSDKTTKTIQENVKLLGGLFFYSIGEPHVIKAECLGKVRCGTFRNDVRFLFIITLSDHTVDIIQAKEGSSNCNTLLAMSLGVDTSAEDEPAATTTAPPPSSDRTVEDIDIPIEILPNLYSLSLSNVSLKHHVTSKNGKVEFNYVTLKCKVNYRLNGRKEGKRKIIFTSYDDKDGIIETRGNYDTYRFTEAGYEFVEVCFNDFGTYPFCKISVSVKENT